MSTTALYKALVYAKVPEELAEKAVDDLPHADSTLTQTEFHHEFKELRNEFQGLRDEFTELRIDFEKCATKEQLDAMKEQQDKFRTDLAEIQMRLIKWMVGLTIGSMLGTISVMIALFGK